MNDINIIWAAVVGIITASCFIGTGYFIGKTYARPIVHEVTEVKEVVRTPKELVRLKHDFMIDEYRSRSVSPMNNMVEREAEKLVHKMIEESKGLYQIVEWAEDFRNPFDKKYSVIIEILPPLNKKY